MSTRDLYWQGLVVLILVSTPGLLANLQLILIPVIGILILWYWQGEWIRDTVRLCWKDSVNWILDQVNPRIRPRE